jgi:hypothetical protein
MSLPRDRHRWLDEDAGPVVRPYAVTRGRTSPAAGAQVGLIDLVLAEDPSLLRADARLNVEHRRLLARCQQAVVVVDLASDANLPVGVVRVLLSDLVQWRALWVVPATQGRRPDERLLREVLDALQAL